MHGGSDLGLIVGTDAIAETGHTPLAPASRVAGGPPKAQLAPGVPAAPEALGVLDHLAFTRPSVGSLPPTLGWLDCAYRAIYR
jgi:hypothetical protein